MPNTFSEADQDLFEDLVEGFDKDLALSGAASTFIPDPEGLQNSGDQFWRPMTMNAETFDGLDITGQNSDIMQLMVPGTLSHIKSVRWKLNALEMRNKTYRKKQAMAARKALGAKIEMALAQNVAFTSANVVKRGALTGYSDISECGTVLTEIGVGRDDRHLFLGTRNYSTMAGSLAGKESVTGSSEAALRDGYVGKYSNFETYDVDVMPSLPAYAGGVITVVGAGQSHVPAVSSIAVSGEESKVDNRFMLMTFDDTTGAAEGDAFTLPDVFKVHDTTKEVLPTLFTYRIIKVVNGTTLKVSAAIASGPFQNVSVAPTNGSSLTFLNTVTSQVNVFWQGDSVEVIHGRLGLDELRGGGLEVMVGETSQGIQIAMLKQGNMDGGYQAYRFIIFFGTCNKNPHHNGVMLAGQS